MRVTSSIPTGEPGVVRFVTSFTTPAAAVAGLISKVRNLTQKLIQVLGLIKQTHKPQVGLPALNSGRIKDACGVLERNPSLAQFVRQPVPLRTPISAVSAEAPGRRKASPYVSLARLSAIDAYGSTTITGCGVPSAAWATLDSANRCAPKASMNRFVDPSGFGAPAQPDPLTGGFRRAWGIERESELVRC